ncbi:nucleotidyltransferase domain-containing protein [Acetobacter sacchari]|uniref:Nucleotidyltransferase domain-containing protein n=2 Tax=Acetobacter sacchari TaxID=2661687 RepID=A0ABS3LUF5_9PROT|nr:nucleotidyltransferase domain-containing protein [Acetobacter sacchari]
MSDAGAVDPKICQIVRQSLPQIESAFGVRILRATEAGPRGYGAGSLDTPHDVQFAYVRKVDWYLRLTPGAEKISLPVSPELNMTGSDIRGVLRSAQSGDFEALLNLAQGDVYFDRPEGWSECAGLITPENTRASDFLRLRNRAVTRSRSWGFGTDQDFAEFFDVVYCLLRARWRADRSDSLPEGIAPLIEGLEDDLRADIHKLLNAKREKAETAVVPPLPRIQIFMDSEMQRLADVSMPAPAGVASEPFDQIFSSLVRNFG